MNFKKRFIISKSRQREKKKFLNQNLVERGKKNEVGKMKTQEKQKKQSMKTECYATLNKSD